MPRGVCSAARVHSVPSGALLLQRLPSPGLEESQGVLRVSGQSRHRAATPAHRVSSVLHEELADALPDGVLAVRFALIALRIARRKTGRRIRSSATTI